MTQKGRWSECVAHLEGAVDGVNLLVMQEIWLNPWVGKIRWRRAWQPTPVVLPGNPQGQRSLVGYIDVCDPTQSMGSQRVGHN